MMHFPWKKVKSTRLSHLLSDQIQQSRGKSVVETGFPTSLVDLFVKNKHRLKKPWRRNNKLSKNSTCLSSLNDDDDNDKNSCCVLLWCPCPPPPPSPVDSSPLRCSEAEAFGHGRVVVDGNGGDIDSFDANNILLRMFLLIVGITISAFLVFLVVYLGEYHTGKAAYFYIFGAFCTAYDFYVGKHVCRLLTACIELEKKLNLLIQKVKHEFFWGILFNLEKYARKLSIRPGAELKEKLRSMISKINEIFGNEKHDQEGEIKILEDLSFPKCCVEEIGGAKQRIGDCVNSTNSGEDTGEIETDLTKNRCENGELKRRKSYEARVKLKMKGLVPKALRSSRKKGRTVQKESNPFVPSLTSLSREFDNGEDLIYNLNDNCELVGRMKMEETLDQEKGKSGSGRNSSYAFMLLAVLIGLIGGRIMALVLTLTCCLMWKSGKTRK